MTEMVFDKGGTEYNRDRVAYFKVGGGLTKSLKCEGVGRGWNDSLTRHLCHSFPDFSD